jgi:hypothetical protein
VAAQPRIRQGRPGNRAAFALWASLSQGLYSRQERDDKKWEPAFVDNHATTSAWSVMTVQRNVITL